MEKWLPIKDYEGLYEVSNIGRVMALPKKSKNYFRIMAFDTRRQYPRLRLFKNGKEKSLLSAHYSRIYGQLATYTRLMD